MTGPVQPGIGFVPLAEDDELATDAATLDEATLALLELDEEGTLEATLEATLERLELEELMAVRTEHSFTPPAIRPPKVASLHTKLPLNDL